MAVWGGLTNSCEKKRNEKQRRKGKIYPFDAEFHRIGRRDKKEEGFFISPSYSEWEKIIANEATDKQLISKINKQLMQLNSRKIIISIL